MSDYDLALDIDPNNFLGHYNRGLLRAQVGDDNRAIEDLSLIHIFTGDTEVKAGADGKIAPETRKFTATKKDYLPGEGQAVIPALNKGQFAFVPVNIFLQKITDAAKDVYPTPDPETIKPETGQVVDGGSYTCLLYTSRCV